MIIRMFFSSVKTVFGTIFSRENKKSVIRDKNVINKKAQKILFCIRSLEYLLAHSAKVRMMISADPVKVFREYARFILYPNQPKGFYKIPEV